MREQALSPHLAYMQSLFGTGALAFAGPFLDDSGGAAFVRAVAKIAKAKKINPALMAPCWSVCALPTRRRQSQSEMVTLRCNLACLSGR